MPLTTRCPGCDDVITVSFDDEAAEQLPADATEEQSCVPGTFRPVDDEDDNFGFLASDHFSESRQAVSSTRSF